MNRRVGFGDFVSAEPMGINEGMAMFNEEMLKLDRYVRTLGHRSAVQR